MKLETLFRPRRLRRTPILRRLVEETHLDVDDLIEPLFIGETSGNIPSLPGITRESLESVLTHIEESCRLGIYAFALFPIVPKEKKTLSAEESFNPEGFLQKAIRYIKQENPSICLITDVALDPYTSHGHDGIVDQEGEVLNDETVEILIKMALVQAEAGADMVAPSDMMDGRIKAIRQALDQRGFIDVCIHAYAAKFASSFYGPFREVLGSSLQFGDKKGYQLNPANAREALLEAQLDEAEGADILMVKPALPYLDILAKIRERTLLPLSAYQVSGEYAMIMAAAEKGWIEAPLSFWESLIGIKRAGADMIFTYAAPLVARFLKAP